MRPTSSTDNGLLVTIPDLMLLYNLQSHLYWKEKWSVGSIRPEPTDVRDVDVNVLEC